MSGWLGKVKNKAVELKNKASEKVKKASNDFLETTASHINKSFRINHHKYKVKRSIAEGGFGFVYQVEAEDGSTFALKHCILQTQEQLQSAQTEIDILVRTSFTISVICVCMRSDSSLTHRISSLCSVNFQSTPILCNWWMQR
jgi:hypothetical protein